MSNFALSLCDDCGHLYPTRMVRTSMIPGSKGKQLCPICALKRKNMHHRLPPTHPFHNPANQKLLLEAIEFGKGRYFKDKPDLTEQPERATDYDITK